MKKGSILKLIGVAGISLFLAACSGSSTGLNSGDGATDQQTATSEGTYSSVQDCIDSIAPVIVLFDYDSSFLDAKDKENIKVAAANLKKIDPDFNIDIVVEGHADERGTREYNLALGARRAAAVRADLISLGVDRKRLKTISYGKERPVDDAHNEEAYAKNRRAVILLREGE